MRKLFLYLPMVLLMGSCIQSEPLNAEADIETCTVLNAKGEKETNIVGNVVKTNNRIMAQANPSIDLSKLSLNVELTDGATITPDPSVLRDYSDPKEFTVTSQDGEWSKTYTVSIDTFDMALDYHFESFELNDRKKYQVFYNLIDNQGDHFKQYIWASGNAGYSLTGVAKTPEDYPTVSIAEGYVGKGVKLVTKSTGDFGAIAKMPIAAGNLFIGSFDVSNAMKDALKATLFGLPFTKEPVTLTGYYKYKRGPVYTVVGGDGKPLPAEGEDYCDIYAVLYESEGLDKNSLNGADVLSSDNIVALARLDNPTVHDYNTDLDKVEYEEFKLDFDYASYQSKRPFDMSKAKNYKYNLAVVFTSSVDGAYFKGAVGSTLYVDEVKVICK